MNNCGYYTPNEMFFFSIDINGWRFGIIGNQFKTLCGLVITLNEKLAMNNCKH